MLYKANEAQIIQLIIQKYFFLYLIRCLDCNPG